jgi:hypothetical protein
MKSTGKLPLFHNFITRLYLLVFVQCLALSHDRETRLFVLLLFCFVCFRSRSHPVPHRGERVKQGTVHPRNIDINASRGFFLVS